MVTPVVVVIDEVVDLGLEVAGQIVALQQDAVLQCLVPALDLALGLGMEGSATDMPDRDPRAIATDRRRCNWHRCLSQQPWPMCDLGALVA